MKHGRIAILGAGNIGTAIANGLVESGAYRPDQITLTRRKIGLLDAMKERGFDICSSNSEGVSNADVIIVAVEPLQVDDVLREVAGRVDAERHIVVSVVTGVRIEAMRKRLGTSIPIVRAMPNTAIAVRESMTCIASDGTDAAALARAQDIFETVGSVMILDEEQMTAATALAACGIAFFLRAIRAASQGGIEIGFHSHDALSMAAQTAKGAADLLLARGGHPEDEIDRVTTPRGCTIAGLNQMEHEGFSSAMIKGIITSARKAGGLYAADGSQS